MIYMKLVAVAEMENRENRVTFKCEYRTSAYRVVKCHRYGADTASV